MSGAGDSLTWLVRILAVDAVLTGVIVTGAMLHAPFSLMLLVTWGSFVLSSMWAIGQAEQAR